MQYADSDRSQIDNLEASGNVTLVNGPDAAEAQQAIYDVETGNITLIGDVLLSQGENILSGDEMTVNLADGTAQVSGRVRSVLQPSLRCPTACIWPRGFRSATCANLPQAAGDPRYVDGSGSWRGGGPAGAERLGQDTCFYCIAGLVAPDAGQVRIDGQDATGLPMFAAPGWASAIFRKRCRSSAA